ncbi:ABC transporter permease [Ectothiorhodospira shaposhnikovii]|nr:ABC transporter ATP-binding protein [Ectothiorhodospira shaposhnikovii]MBK1674265.1 ABC transporter permease [Ectothiorhodospira shaposhnikovii]
MIDPPHPALWRVLFGLLHDERGPLLAALSVAVIAALFELLPYWLLYQSIVLVLSGTQVADGLTRLAGWMAVALVAKYGLYSFAYYLSHRAAYQILANLRRDLARRLVWVPLTELQGYSSGELKKIVMHDVERLEQFIAHHSVEFIAALAGPLFVALFLLWLDWRLALAALAVVPLAALAQSLFMRGASNRIEDFDNAVGELSGSTVEYVRNIPVMKAFRQEVGSFRRMRRVLERYHGLVTAVIRQTIPGWSVFTVLLSANILFILPTGMWLVSQGALDLPDLILALMLGTGMLKPLFKVVRFSSETREILGGVRRIAPFLTWSSPAPQSPVTLTATPGVNFDAVSFAYDDTPVLRDLSFELPPGKLTAMVGPSGAGKSTVAHLLGGLARPQQGTIRLDGISLDSLDEAQRASLVSVATQEAFLFRGTLMDNLKLASPDADEAAVRRAARVAQADAFILALPEGYNTRIEERGVRLSGGERQRIAIARALLADTPVLVLDEATAFADSLTERAFYNALHEAYPHKTLLVIAHRLYTIEQADQVLVMEGGRLVDAGRHDELITRCGLYQRLWQRQSVGESWTIGKKEVVDAGVS